MDGSVNKSMDKKGNSQKIRVGQAWSTLASRLRTSGTLILSGR